MALLKFNKRVKSEQELPYQKEEWIGPLPNELKEQVLMFYHLKTRRCLSTLNTKIIISDWTCENPA